MSTYQTLMEEGETHVNEGNYHAAVNCFYRAEELVPNTLDAAKACQWRGIAHRLNKELAASRIVLERAVELVANSDIQLLARIKRDLAMTIMEQALQQPRRSAKRAELLDEAGTHLTESYDSLKRRNPLEAAATRGFIGRLRYHEGLRGMAAALMRMADRELSAFDNPDYILNNLMSLILVVSRSERKALRPRILRLIEATGQTRRYIELKIIMIGGDRLYRLVRRVTGR